MRAIVSIALVSFAVPALAEPLTIDLPDGPVDRQTVTYSCGDNRTITAEYINAGNNSLAIVDLGEGPVVMVNVLAGSGAKYVGQQYEWWTKGNDANLTDLIQGPDAQPLSCTGKG